MEDIEIIDERGRYNSSQSNSYYGYSYYSKKFTIHEGTLLYDYVSKWLKNGKEVRLVRSIVFDEKTYFSFTAGKVMYTFEEDKMYVGKCKFVYTIMSYDYGGEEWRPVISIPGHPRYKFIFTGEGSNPRWMIFDVITLSRISATCTVKNLCL